MQEVLEKYLQRLRRFGYSEEQVEAAKEFREKSEHMTYEQYLFLLEKELVHRKSKLKKPRNIYFFENKLWVLNHYHKKYNCVGWLHSEEFIEERERKREEEKTAIAERRTEKKRLKQLAKNPPQKPKRKRIQKNV